MVDSLDENPFIYFWYSNTMRFCFQCRFVGVAYSYLVAWYCDPLFGFYPRLIRIVLTNGLSQLSGIRAEVLLINNSILIDNEGHHSRDSVFHRVGQEGKAACHLAIDDVVLRAPCRVRS